MAGYPCPTCGRALKLGDELLGALVKCPLCGTEFEAPTEPPPSRPLPVPLRAIPIPPPRRERSPLSFPETVEELGPRGEASLRSAAFWLQATVLVQGISGLLCCCGPGFEGDGNGLVFTLPVTLVLKYVPLLFTAVAASRLQVRRSPGLCRAGAILALWTTLWGLLEALIGASILAFEHRKHYPPGAVLTLVCALFSVPGVACGFVGSIKTLTLLSRPDVLRAFR